MIQKKNLPEASIMLSGDFVLEHEALYSLMRLKH